MDIFPFNIYLVTIDVGAVHPLYGSSKGSFYQSGPNLKESDLKATETSNIPTLEERLRALSRRIGGTTLD